MPSARAAPAFLFDLDGTLVGSVYQHVLAWREALEQAGIELSVWGIHRRIGMSGGLLVNALLRETRRVMTVEEIARLQHGHAVAYARHAAHLRPLPGARELLAYLTQAGAPWAIATSERRDSAQPAPARLGIPPDVPIVTRDEVERAKPTPTSSWARPADSASTPARRSWWATASGTCSRPAAPGHSASACSRVATARTSGAISGVLGAYLVLFPYARVLTLIPVFVCVQLVEVPAVLYIGFWFVMQLVSGTLTLGAAGDAGGVAWGAHVGGFALGLALAVVLRRLGPTREWRTEYVP